MSGAVTATGGQRPAFPRKRLVRAFTRRRTGGGPTSGRRSGRPVTLTGRGEELLSAVEQVYAELEDGWAKLIGTSHLDRRLQIDARHLGKAQQVDGHVCEFFPGVRDRDELSRGGRGERIRPHSSRTALSGFRDRQQPDRLDHGPAESIPLLAS